MSSGLELTNVLVAVVTLFVTVVIYNLGRKLSMRGRMAHRDRVGADVRALRNAIGAEGLNSQVVLMNSARYERGHYPHREGRWSPFGPMYTSGEMAEVRHDGVEFILHGVETWETRHGRRTLRRTSRPAESAIAVGFVPFDAIDYVNLDGDEFFNKPIFYRDSQRSSRLPFATSDGCISFPTESGLVATSTTDQSTTFTIGSQGPAWAAETGPSLLPFAVAVDPHPEGTARGEQTPERASTAMTRRVWTTRTRHTGLRRA